MKLRITSLILAMVMLLMMLSGCGAAEATLEATTMAATEAPTTEPTTEPTEPPTALEQLGYELWDGVTEVVEIGGVNMYGDELPISRGLSGVYNNFKAYVELSFEDGKTYKDLLTAPLDVNIYEFSASSFDDDIDWMKETLKPFYQYCKEQESSNYSFAEWVSINQDKKLLWVNSLTKIDGTVFARKAINEGFGELSNTRSTSVYSIEIVNPVTGEYFNTVDGNYDAFTNPKVGCWKMNHHEGEILALRKIESSGWFGEYGMQLNMTEDVFVLIPAEYEDICFAVPETAIIAESIDEDDKNPETEDMWETGSVLEDYVTEERNFYFVGLD